MKRKRNVTLELTKSLSKTVRTTNPKAAYRRWRKAGWSVEKIDGFLVAGSCACCGRVLTDRDLPVVDMDGVLICRACHQEVKASTATVKP